jgi:DNA-binding transcriptional regulator YiaG
MLGEEAHDAVRTAEILLDKWARLMAVASRGDTGTGKRSRNACGQHIDRKLFGRIVELRKKRTQVETARILGLSAGTVRSVERGEHRFCKEAA